MHPSSMKAAEAGSTIAATAVSSYRRRENVAEDAFRDANGLGTAEFFQHPKSHVVDR